MDNDTLTLIRDRLSRIEAQNDEQLALLRDHIEIDAKAHAVVERHSTYFSVLGITIPVIVTYIATKLGLK